MEEPTFSKINKNNFKTPEGYFENIEDRIFSKMNSDNIGRRVIPINKDKSTSGYGRKIAFAISAVAACLTFMIFYNRDSAEHEFNLSQVDNTEIINYLNENADEVELEILVNKEAVTSNPFELLDKESLQTESGDIIDDIQVEDLF